MVDIDLVDKKIMVPNGEVSDEVAKIITFDFTTSIPTTGIIAKGCSRGFQFRGCAGTAVADRAEHKYQG